MAYDFDEYLKQLISEDALRQYANARDNYQPAEQPTYTGGFLDITPQQVMSMQKQPIPAGEQPAPQATTNDFDAKTAIDKMTMAATQQPRNRLETNQQIQIDTSGKPPNPFSIGLQKSIAEMKILNELAPLGASGDALRAVTSQNANAIREQANAAGIDLSQFGANSATAQDAWQQIQSQKARHIMDAIEGQFSKTADQYYDQKYDDLILQGYSVGKAKRVAGSLAKKYQANRVAYLRGIYGSYGRDENGTNDLGADMLGMMSQENPSLANYYAQIYPLPRDTIARRQQLEDKALDQTNAFAKLDLVHNYDVENMIRNFILKQQDEDNSIGRYKNKVQFQTNEAIRQYAATKGMPQSEIDKLIQQGTQWGAANGLSGEELEQFALNYVNKAMIYGLMGKDGKGGGNANNGTSPKFNDYTGRRNSLITEANSIRTQLSKEFGLPPEEQEELKKKLKKVEEQIAEIDTAQRNAMRGDVEIKFQGKENEQTDIAIVNQIWESFKGVYSDEQIKDMIYKKIKSQTGDEEYAKRLAGMGMN